MNNLVSVYVIIIVFSYTFLTIRNKLFIAFQKAVHWNVKYKYFRISTNSRYNTNRNFKNFPNLPFFLFLSFIQKSPVQVVYS